VAFALGAAAKERPDNETIPSRMVLRIIDFII